MELAKLQDGQLIYGTYEECEEYADKENTCVERYLDHVNPSTVYKNFKWVGTGLHNPFAVSVPFNYREARSKGNFTASGVNKDKW